MFEGSLGLIKPGNTFGKACDYILAFGKGRGVKSLVMIKRPELGEEGPFAALTASARPEAREVRFQGGNARVWKPTIYPEDMKSNYIWGGCVIVHDSGPEVVGKRSQGLISIL